MKKQGGITIQKLRLSYFKGVKDLEIDLGGSNASIFGDNATGKTTIYDAFLWLLFDKDSGGSASFGVKTRENGVELQAVDHIVEAELIVRDETLTTLKKTLREKWVKKRGRIEQEFEGHEILYEINGVPKKKKEYDEFVQSIALESQFRLITSPTYFNEQLKWADRRQLLIDTCGDITDSDVVATAPELKDLQPLIGTVSVNDLRKMKNSERQKINRELTEIPGRIDEATKAMPSVSGNSETLMRQAKQAAAELEKLHSEKLALQNGGAVQALGKKLAEIDTAIAQARNEHLKSVPDVSAERKRLYELEEGKGRWGQITDLTPLRQKEKEIAGNAQGLASQWKAINGSAYTPSDNCPYCKQAWPEALQGEQEATFNAGKSKLLEEVIANGQKNGRLLQEVRSQIEKAEAANQDAVMHGERIAKEIEAISAEIQRKLNIPSFEETPEHAEFVAQRKQIETDLDAARKSGSASTRDVDAKIEAKQSELGAANKQITQIDTADQQQRRIDELKARQKELAAQFEASERILYLIDLFEHRRAAMLDEAINGKFGLVRWKLTNTLINGGVEPTCICTVGGVPYPDLNNAAKIQAGLDIIRTISRERGIAAPVFIDNAESITSLPEMECQVIELIVSEKDKSLRVELV